MDDDISDLVLVFSLDDEPSPDSILAVGYSDFEDDSNSFSSDLTTTSNKFP